MSRQRSLWESSERVEELQARTKQPIFGDRDGQVVVARGSFGVDHFDVGARAGAEADVRVVDALMRLARRGPGARQAPFAAGDRLARSAHFCAGPRAPTGEPRPGLVDIRTAQHLRRGPMAA